MADETTAQERCVADESRIFVECEEKGINRIQEESTKKRDCKLLLDNFIRKDFAIAHVEVKEVILSL